MGARTGQTGADVAWARPSEIPADLILGYSGPARPTVEQINAWGKPFLLGFESATTRAYAGRDAGIADAQWHESRARDLGYPADCGTWVCAADTPSTPAVFWPAIRDYFAAWRSVIGPTRPLLAYGNRDAVREALAGGATLAWGVGTWGYGETSWGAPPAESDAHLIQSGNNPGPAEGTDLNWLYCPLELFAAWHGPTPAPTPTPSEKKGPDMLFIAHTLDTQTCDLWTETGVKLDVWQNTDNRNPFGVGEKLAAYVGQGIPVVTYRTTGDYTTQAYNDLMRIGGHPHGPGTSNP